MSNVKIPLTGIKAAIFDMDGTMVDNMWAHKQAWQEFLKRHGIEVSDDEFREKLSGQKNSTIMETIFGVTEPGKVAAMADEKEAIYREIYKLEIREIDGLSRAIDELHAQGVKTAVATTAIAVNRDFVLDTLDLGEKFEVVLGDEHAKKGKPDPEIYLNTARELGVEPSECLVFEDSPPGVGAGKAAGMTVVGILSRHTKDEISGADYYVKDFTEISFS